MGDAAIMTKDRNAAKSELMQDDPKFDSAVAQEIEQVTRESGLSAQDAWTLAILGIHGAILLRRRMIVVGVDPDWLSLSEPAAFRELQKCCSACDSHARCRLDLAQDAIDPRRLDWQEYCPNVATLKMLSAVESCYQH